MPEVDKPTSTLFQVVSLALIVWFSIALFFFLVAWAVGGGHYYDGLLGSYTFPVVVAGFVAGLASHLMARTKT